MFWNDWVLVYKDQPQRTMRLKKDRQTDLELHTVQFLGNLLIEV